MKKTSKILALLCIVFCVTIFKTEATAITYTWTGASDGNWQNAGNWTASSGSSYPTLNTDIVIINSATNQPTASYHYGTNIFRMASLTLNTNASLTCSSINLYVYGDVILNSGSALTYSGGGVSGDITGNLTGSGTFVGGTDFEVDGTFSVSNFTANGSAVSLGGTSNLGAYTFSNLTINGSTTLTGDIVVTGAVSGTGTLDPVTHNISVGTGISITHLTTGTSSSTVTTTAASCIIGGAYTFNNLTINNTTNTSYDIVINGNLAGSSTFKSFTHANTAASHNFSVGGSMTVALLSVGSGSCTCTLTGTSNLGAYTFDNLTINGTVTLTGNIIVNGNLSGSGTLIPVSYTVSVSGNTTINTIMLTGTSPSVNAQTFNNLTINCTSAATLSGNITVNGTLTFTSGKLDLGNYKLTIGPSGSISGFTSSSYIYTSGSGTLEMTVTTSGVTFQIGDDYNPITIIPSSGTAIYDIGVSNGVTNASNSAINNHAVNATWTITVTSGSQAVTVIPQWDLSQELGGFDRTNSYVATRTSLTSAWVPTASPSNATVLSGTTFAQTSGTFTITAGNTYYIGVGDNISALPVSLISFDATRKGTDADLSWTTASEINNDYFGIERSLDVQNWETIGHVPGHGNSQVMETYEFTDGLQGIVPSGAIYYRLKQVDFNQKFEYSEIKAVNIEANSLSLQTYPNPAGNVLNLNWTNADNGNVILKLINTTGSTIYTQNVSGQGIKSNQIDLSNFASGTYFLQIVSVKDVISRMVYKE